jgi:hypothetical protein
MHPDFGLGWSRKLENHKHAISLFIAAYIPPATYSFNTPPHFAGKKSACASVGCESGYAPVKILAAIVNGTWLVVLIVLFIKNPPNNNTNSSSDILLGILFFGTPIFNLIALFWRGKTHDWLSLFLQRKALEEKKKMEALNTKGRDN